jgi:hypothetical protein
MDAVLNQDEVKTLLSAEHFSVDGTLIQAWASMKSFRRKDGKDEPPGPGRNGTRDFHPCRFASRRGSVGRTCGNQDVSGRISLRMAPRENIELSLPFLIQIAIRFEHRARGFTGLQPGASEVSVRWRFRRVDFDEWLEETDRLWPWKGKWSAHCSFHTPRAACLLKPTKSTTTLR